MDIEGKISGYLMTKSVGIREVKIKIIELKEKSSEICRDWDCRTGKHCSNCEVMPELRKVEGEEESYRNNVTDYEFVDGLIKSLERHDIVTKTSDIIPTVTVG